MAARCCCFNYGLVILLIHSLALWIPDTRSIYNYIAIYCKLFNVWGHRIDVVTDLRTLLDAEVLEQGVDERGLAHASVAKDLDDDLVLVVLHQPFFVLLLDILRGALIVVEVHPQNEVKMDSD